MTASGIHIGRHSSNEVVIFDESVSRFHAQIVFEDDQFFLQDIGSTTGTFVKILQPTPISQNDIFEVGSFQFIARDIYLD